MYIRQMETDKQCKILLSFLMLKKNLYNLYSFAQIAKQESTRSTLYTFHTVLNRNLYTLYT